MRTLAPDRAGRVDYRGEAGGRTNIWRAHVLTVTADPDFTGRLFREYRVVGHVGYVIHPRPGDGQVAFVRRQQEDGGWAVKHRSRWSSGRWVERSAGRGEQFPGNVYDLFTMEVAGRTTVREAFCLSVFYAHPGRGWAGGRFGLVPKGGGWATTTSPDSYFLFYK